MKHIKILLTVALCLMAVSAWSQLLDKGVSKELAEQRKATISDVTYDLTFNIPAEQKSKVTGKAVINFNLKAKVDVMCMLARRNVLYHRRMNISSCR